MIRTSVIALALVTQAVTAGEPKKCEGKLIQPLNYHGDETSAEDGQRWLALLHQPNGTYKIRSVAIRVERVNDPIVDENGQKSGKEISPRASSGEAIFFFKGISGIRPGPAETLPPPAQLKPNTPILFKLSSGKSYTLTLSCTPPNDSANLQQVPAALVLKHGEISQTLGTFNASYKDGKFSCVGKEGELGVIWAGDLNADGSLDLLINMTDHYNVSLPTLFLSPGGSGEPIVRKVAQLISTGC